MASSTSILNRLEAAVDDLEEIFPRLSGNAELFRIGERLFDPRPRIIAADLEDGIPLEAGNAQFPDYP